MPGRLLVFLQNSSLSFTLPSPPVNPSLVLPVMLKHPFLRPPLSLTHYTFLYSPILAILTHTYFAPDTIQGAGAQDRHKGLIKLMVQEYQTLLK